MGQRTNIGPRTRLRGDCQPVRCNLLSLQGEYRDFHRFWDNGYAFPGIIIQRTTIQFLCRVNRRNLDNFSTKRGQQRLNIHITQVNVFRFPQGAALSVIGFCGKSKADHSGIHFMSILIKLEKAGSSPDSHQQQPLRHWIQCPEMADLVPRKNTANTFYSSMRSNSPGFYQRQQTMNHFNCSLTIARTSFLACSKEPEKKNPAA